MRPRSVTATGWYLSSAGSSSKQSIQKRFCDTSPSSVPSSSHCASSRIRQTGAWAALVISMCRNEGAMVSAVADPSNNSGKATIASMKSSFESRLSGSSPGARWKSESDTVRCARVTPNSFDIACRSAVLPAALGPTIVVTSSEIGMEISFGPKQRKPDIVIDSMRTGSLLNAVTGTHARYYWARLTQ